MLRERSPETETNETPENIFIWKECCQVLSSTLATVGDNCKKILGYWSLGYSFKEIADFYKISEANAKMRLYRIIDKLKQKWSEQ